MRETTLSQSLLSLFMAMCVLLGVTGCATDDDDAAIQPAMGLETTEITFTGLVGEQLFSKLAFTNSGRADLEFEFSESPGWLTIAPRQGRVRMGKATEVTFGATCPEESTDRRTTVVLHTNDEDHAQTNISVRLECTEPVGDEPGKLEVSVVGMPTAVEAAITITGPEAYSQTLSSSSTLDDLRPGTYTILAEDVSAGHAVLTPSPREQTVTVEDATTAQATVTYATQFGALNVAINGLPASVDGDVTITGPEGFSETVTSTRALTALMPGAYVITPADVTAGPARYSADTVEVTVVSGETADAAIAYELVTSSLQVTINGLPASVDGDVTLTGPGGFSEHLTQSTTFTELVPGTYTISPAEITREESTYVAAVSTVTITSGQQQEVTVVYVLNPATLEITIAGLGGLAADVLISGPQGYSRTVTGDETLLALPPGDYEVSPRDVVDGNSIYVASEAVFSLSSGEVGQLHIVYELVPGSLSIIVTGLPDGAAASVMIANPDSSTTPVGASATFEGLEPGTYEVTASDVTLGPGTYTVDVTSATVELSSGDAAELTFVYTVTPGDLTVNVSGLPAELSADVSISGPNGYSHSLSESEVLSDLPPGEYLVEAATVQDALGNAFFATPASSTIVVSSGQAASVDVTYTDPRVVTTSANSGAGSLRHVVSSVVAGSTVQFADGITSITLLSPITITTDLDLVGPGADDLTISGNDLTGLVIVGANVAVSVTGVTFSQARGAAIHNSGTLILEDCAFLDNQAMTGDGGAIYTEGVLSVSRCDFFDNTAGAASGGAIANESGLAIVTDSNFAFNHAAIGGAIHNDAGELRVTRTSFQDNSADESGGAIGSVGVAMIESSLFTSNSAEFGGAVFTFGNLEVTNSTLTLNSADHGGAILNEDSRTTLISNTIVGNTATVLGGGIWQFGDQFTWTDLGRNIIAANQAPNDADIAYFEWEEGQHGNLSSLGYNLIGQADNVQGLADGVDGDMIGTAGSPLDPALKALDFNGGLTRTMAPEHASPARGAAPASACLNKDGSPTRIDQRGFARPTMTATCDLGAVELGAVETFDNPGLTASYLDGSINGNHGIVWTFTESRDESSFGIDGKGLMLRDDRSTLVSQSIPGGISTFSVQLRKAFTGASSRRVELLVNGVSMGESETFGAFSGGSEEIIDFIVDDINVAGPVIIEVRNLGAQVVIDNLTWNSYTP